MKRISTAVVGLVATLVTAAVLLTGLGPVEAIIGGTQASPAWYPYFVHVHRVDSSNQIVGSCGGTIVDPNWVLTAAHCVNYEKSDIQPSFHPVSAIRVQRSGDLVPILELAPHPLYKRNGGAPILYGEEKYRYDVALLRVPQSFTAGVAPIAVGRIVDESVYAAGTPATMMGSGWTKTSGRAPGEPITFNVLDTPLRSDSDMDDVYNRWYGPDYWNSRLMIGAGTNSRTICKGDSGGPLVVQSNGVPVQVGVASFADTTNEDCDRPGAFAELSDAILSWIGSIADVRFRWEPCTDQYGQTGVWISRWSTEQSGTSPNHDNFEYWWGFTCHVEPPQPQPNTQPAPPTRGGGLGTGPSAGVDDSSSRPPSRGWDGQTAPAQHMEPQPASPQPQPRPRPGTTQWNGTSQPTYM